ncbi:MAG: isoprenylcysteine carboxylmethyltransferase family protein [Pseudomonadota bacterium]
MTAALQAPPGGRRKLVAIAFGLSVHLAFAIGVGAMILAMYFGMSRSFGAIDWPVAGIVNALLILQFPLLHSLLLTRSGSQLLARIVPGTYGGALSTTTFALIASLQLLLLFCCWTPSGVVWWQADGQLLTIWTVAYACTWLLVGKSTWDAGIEVQSGALGWLSMFAKRKPVYPDMPTSGLFRRVRQPIYVSFALTMWTVPVWTPDQLVLATVWTLYCLLAPILKERRLTRRYGQRFTAYQERVPYALPRLPQGLSTDE